MADVFLSYKKQERARAEEVAAAITSAGYSVWWDDGLSPRGSWDAEIEREIAQAKAVLVLWSPEAASEKSFVRKEAGYALDHNKLVPAWIEKCTLPIRFRDVQTADLSGWSGADAGSKEWRRVLRWISHLVGRVPAEVATIPSTPPAVAEALSTRLQAIIHHPMALAGLGILAVVLLVVVLSSGSGSNDGVMNEIRRAEKTHADAVQQAADAMSRAVQEDPQRLLSGLELQFRRRGVDESLPRPTINANVLVHYEGSFVDGGEVFDSSFARNEPAEFPLQAVVAGFREAITHMRPGDEVVATFPGSLGYGASGSGRIPPNAALRFRIVLLAFQEPGGQPVHAPGQ